MPTAKELYIGDVLFRIKEDIVFLRPVGEFSLAHAQRFLLLTEEVMTHYGYSLVLADLEKAGPIPADARRLLAQSVATRQILAVAFYHVSPFIRGMNALLFGAMNLYSKRRQNMMQFSTEDAAVQWLNAERKRLLS